MLELKDYSVTAPGGAILLDRVNISIKKGEILGLCGVSGSGKSMTTLAILDYLPLHLKHSGGTVVWHNEPLPHDFGIKAAAVFQMSRSALNPLQRCGTQLRENIVIGHKIGRKSLDIDSLVSRYCQNVQLPEHLLQNYPHQLSGGESQRLCIAMAIALRPLILIADEPTTALHPKLQTEILDLLLALCKQKNMAMLLISHDWALVKKYAERVVYIDAGKIQISALDQNLAIPKSRQIASHVGVPVLEVSDLCHRYPDAHQSGTTIEPAFTFKNISFTLYRGETLAIVGASGCGKSTLARSLCLPEGEVTGTVHLNGRLAVLRPNQLVDTRIQMVWQDANASLNPSMTAGQILHEVAKVHQTAVQVHPLAQQIGLDHALLGRYPSELSGGQKQRVAIVRALLAQPDVLILDEITASLDSESEAATLALIQSLQPSLAIVMITHKPEIAQKLGSFILDMTKV
jgi:ABC-type glutathione transport system ATPase component